MSEILRRSVEVLRSWRRGPSHQRQSARPSIRAGEAQTSWSRALDHLADRGHYMDSFLGELKRNAYLQLIDRWGGVPAAGWTLKTDMFEEAGGPDAFGTDFLGRGTSVVGMDVSIAIIRRAAESCTPRGLRCVAADARHLPFATDTFSLIVSPSSLDHFENPADLGVALRELARVLRSDGRLIITLDNRQNVTDPLLRVAIRLGVVPYYVGRAYTVHELREELHQAGFRVEDTTAIIQHPRLLAVALTKLTRRLGSASLIRLTQQAFVQAQRLEQTRWRYHMGCFVAAKATPRKTRGSP